MYSQSYNPQATARFRAFAWILYGIGGTPFRRFAYICGSFIFSGLDLAEIAQGATTSFGVPGLKWVFAIWFLVAGLIALWETCNGRYFPPPGKTK